uniref:U3 small nucleolar ribonucleoprotein MPP10 n=2 Tax=Lygus hesperus TaxID=30085 RepID=A0A0A9WSV1_LYGHE
MFANLCHKLDSLTNFTYTPKAPVQELQVIHAAPALSVEEILPVGVSNEQRVAPQEVFQPTTHGLLASVSEQTREEKRALRKSRLSKRKKYLEGKHDELVTLARSGDKRAKGRLEAIDLEKRARKAAKKGVLRTGAKQDSTKYSTSTQFFQKLQASSTV